MLSMHDRWIITVAVVALSALSAGGCAGASNQTPAPGVGGVPPADEATIPEGFEGVVSSEAGAQERRGAVGAIKLPPPAHALGDDQRLDGVLGGLRWGASHGEALDHIEAEVMDVFLAEVEDVRDVARRDRVRQQYEAFIAQVRDSYLVLDDDQADRSLRASFVYDAYATGNDESVFKLRDGRTTRYFFFHKDRLYKIVVAYDRGALGERSFIDFAAAVRARYGDYAATYHDERDRIVAVEWEDAHANRLRVKDRLTGLGAVVMSFTSGPMADELAALHDFAARQRDAQEVDATIAGLSTGGDPLEGNNAASELVGAQERDLHADLPQSDLERMQEEERRLRAARDSGAHGSEATGAVGRSSSRTSSTRRSERRQQALDQADADQGIIIY